MPVGPLWTDVVQAISSVGVLVTTILGFIFLYRQVKQIDRSIESGTGNSLYTLNMELMEILVNKPELRQYLYDGVDLQEDDTSYPETMSYIEIVAVYFEHVTLQKDCIPRDVWDRWTNYILAMYSSSPLLRRHFSDNPSWYSDDILNLLPKQNPHILVSPVKNNSTTGNASGNSTPHATT